MKPQQGGFRKPAKTLRHLHSSYNFDSLQWWKQKTSVPDLFAGDENMAFEIDFCQTDYFVKQYRFSGGACYYGHSVSKRKVVVHNFMSEANMWMRVQRVHNVHNFLN